MAGVVQNGENRLSAAVSVWNSDIIEQKQKGKFQARLVAGAPCQEAHGVVAVVEHLQNAGLRVNKRRFSIGDAEAVAEAGIIRKALYRRNIFARRDLGNFGVETVLNATAGNMALHDC